MSSVESTELRCNWPGNANPNVRFLILFLACASRRNLADELPPLPASVDLQSQTHAMQKQKLNQPYVSTSPEDLGDGLAVGSLDVPGTNEAVATLLKNDRAGKYSELESLLLWKDGKLLFEMYSRGGRVDAPHCAMSVTKTLTSIALARAIQLGLLAIEDLEKPVVDLLPEIDHSNIQSGVEAITLKDALHMKSGLRFQDNSIHQTVGETHKRQDYFQQLFECTAPVTQASKIYNYTGIDPSIVMMAIDVKSGGKVQSFIKNEVAQKFGAIYCWDDQACGLPKCGSGSNFTSRSLLKIGTAVVQGGMYNGEQLLSADYIRLVLGPKPEEGYYYFFHNRKKTVNGRKVDFISGIGAGGQYMATFPELNIVVVTTADNRKGISLPLRAFLNNLIPLFVK